MAKKLRVGDTLRGYTVTKVFGPGAMAISYAARAPGGERIFLKQYKSPAPTVVWYGPFVDYQQELAHRVRTGKAALYVVKLVDAFEESWGGPCYFQAYELIERGNDLQHILEAERESHARTGVHPASSPEVWARHVTWAKVFMAAIAALHEAQIVHADLKPANAFLVEDPTIAAGYQLKLIDTDFSVLADKRAPWHGFQAYVGTDNYRSPEHLTRKATPLPASDVFTCGLILHELLGGVHPYWREDQTEYAALVRSWAAKPVPLLGVMPGDASNEAVSTALHRCLAPDPGDRPTAAELRAVLSGRERRATAATPAAPDITGAERPAAPTAVARPPASPAPGSPLVAERLRLVAEGGRSLEIGVRTELGRHLARQLGSDAVVWDTRQVVLERGPDGRWLAAPAGATTNETLLNGEVLTAPRQLSEGDVLAIGRKAKGIAKMPLTVQGAQGRA